MLEGKGGGRFSTNLEIAECPIAVIKRLTILGNIYILDDFPSRSIDIKVDSMRGHFAYAFSELLTTRQNVYMAVEEFNANEACG